MSEKLVIALDGPAASGKGTLGRALSDKMGLAYFDTGKLYRAVGMRMIDTDRDFDNENDVLTATDWLVEHFTPELLQDARLKSDEAGVGASKSGKYGAMRSKLLELQRDFAKNPQNYLDEQTASGLNGVLLDGRDIGTVVCPDADVKLFVTADIEKRAERRLKELQNNGVEVTYSDILADMKARDARDASREAAPMLAADDAVVVDTSDMTPADALARSLEIIADKAGITIE